MLGWHSAATASRAGLLLRRDNPGTGWQTGAHWPVWYWTLTRQLETRSTSLHSALLAGWPPTSHTTAHPPTHPVARRSITLRSDGSPPAETGSSGPRAPRLPDWTGRCPGRRTGHLEPAIESA